LNYICTEKFGIFWNVF